MWYFVYGLKKPDSPLVGMQLAERSLRESGFRVFDPANDGGFTVAGMHDGLQILATVTSMAGDGGMVVAINTFTANQAAADAAGRAAKKVYDDIATSVRID